ncbi:intercompartmental signaling factor BofC [Neobacillus sp. MM2021_6]|uniref:intercompartmental signaling factor BofC n=1 Tax=Bacillaceae TaxID=186817 RepID=UPI001407875E|nr:MULTISPECIES: intercompartmental signaling factor BofC [Bacillaceae]MBO0960740.1 intercompartmental signaling factor BofC [Neobacillus sp. MM2021_6]NHC17338.1 regulator [Bacillus sp. MM2020_4]
MRASWIAMNRFLLAVTAVILFMFIGSAPRMLMYGAAAQQDNHRAQPLTMTVILERVYLDGEISQEVIHETSWSMENFWAKYDQWQLTDIDESTFVFRQQVDDISPLLKANGFFGVTEDGILTIFNGRPGQSRIIQSFFQIDILKLESKKQEELIKGIPIKSKDQYVQVLETFKPYSVKKE